MVLATVLLGLARRPTEISRWKHTAQAAVPRRSKVGLFWRIRTINEKSREDEMKHERNQVSQASTPSGLFSKNHVPLKTSRLHMSRISCGHICLFVYLASGYRWWSFLLARPPVVSPRAMMILRLLTGLIGKITQGAPRRRMNRRPVTARERSWLLSTSQVLQSDGVPVCRMLATRRIATHRHVTSCPIRTRSRSSRPCAGTFCDAFRKKIL